MKQFEVEISYTYEIEAKDEQDAEEQASELYGDDAPRHNEVNYEVKEIKP